MGARNQQDSTLATCIKCGIIFYTMYVHLPNQGYRIAGWGTCAAVCSDSRTRLAGGLTSRPLSGRTPGSWSSVRTTRLFHQPSAVHMVSELGALYQQHTASTAKCSAALRMVLGYESTILARGGSV